MLSAALAEHLGDAGLGLVWQDTGVYPDGVIGLYVEQLPAIPDLAVAVLSDQGGDSDSLLGWDEPRFQIRINGDRNPGISYDIARRIYSHLHGLTDVLLSDGTWLGLATCMSSGPVASAPDETGRWQWTVSVATEVTAPTEHRT